MENGEQECVMLLGQWPDTTGVDWSWIYHMQALHPTIPAEFLDLSLEQAIQKLVSMLQKHCTRSIFKHLHTTHLATWAFKTRYSKQDIRTDHIPEVFIGSVLPHNLSRLPFLGPKDVGDLISLSTIVMLRLTSLL